MGALTDSEILAALEQDSIDIEPFTEDQLTPNGYDLAIAEVVLPDTGRCWTEGTARVPPMTRFMVSTRERVRLGPEVTAQLWLRTSWARRGVQSSFGRVDAGFDGTLTFGGFNSSQRPLEVPLGETFAQLVLERLEGRVGSLYEKRSGHYQHQRGVTMADPGEDGEQPPEVDAPCIERGCHLCCLDTEMPLSPQDVERLASQGHDPGAFSVVEGGITFLANVDGRCFFLDDGGRCVVYQDRPQGCRLYPLTMDEELSDFLLDDLCPHGVAAKVLEEHREALLELLDSIGVQRRNH